jgi:hypothetical protein
MPGSTNTWFPFRDAVMLCWAAISLMTGPAWPGAAGAAVAGAALAAVAMTSPAAVIAAVITFRRFNASYSFRCANAISGMLIGPRRSRQDQQRQRAGARRSDDPGGGQAGMTQTRRRFRREMT